MKKNKSLPALWRSGENAGVVQLPRVRGRTWVAIKQVRILSGQVNLEVIMKNKIGWCNLTFNPVWGCNNHCEYCYARTFSKRFWKRMFKIEMQHYYKKHPTWAWTGDQYTGIINNFKPTFLESQFDKKFPKKPQRIFVGSMSEIYYWKDEWIEMVIEKVKQYPQHTFQFLTKFPEVYLRYYFPKNCWLGITIVGDIDKIEFQKFKISNPNNLKFICFEPLIKNVSINLDFIDWIILGSETGNRKGKIILKKEWIEDFVTCYKDNDIPIYLKDSLKDIYPAEIKEFPI